MKKIIAVLLCCIMLLTGCTFSNNDYTDSEEVKTASSEGSVSGLNDPDFLPYISEQVYEDLSQKLNSDEYIIDNIEATYISKEYIEESEYNSKKNVYFGFTLSEIADQFDEKSYVFDINKNGETVVSQLENYDDTFEQVIKNVAVGTGVILFNVTLLTLTKNPAITGKTVKILFSLSSNAVKLGTGISLSSAAISGTISAITEAMKTDDIKQIAEKSLVNASKGFKWGAIIGTLAGYAKGINIYKNTAYFKEGSLQASKYPEGIKFTKGPDGEMYPRFEKWKIATAKFETPTREKALNHTGLSGNYWYDSKLANAQCGFADTPTGHVWHHCEDMKTMILVPQDVHSVSFGGMYHKGGASLIRKMLGM